MDKLSDGLSTLSMDAKASQSGERYRVGVHIADVSHFVKPGSGAFC